MKAMKLIYLPLLVIFVPTIDTTGKPCSTSGNLPVVNICTDDTTLQDNHSNSVLIKADTMRNCTCELYVRNQTKSVTVNIQKFGPETSSSPLNYSCGLSLKFAVGTDTFWAAQCIVHDAVISNNITINNKITIRSMTVSGTLKANEGYCIEMKKVSDQPGNQLELKCGIGSTITTNTTQSAEKTTKMTQITIPTTTMTIITTMPITKTTLPTTVPITTTTTTVPTTTITKTTKITEINTNVFEISNSTSTDGSVTTNPKNKPDDTDNDYTTVLGVCASVGGIVIIIVVIAVIYIYRRNHSKSASKPVSKQGLAVNNDNDDYGLRENVLYIPADSTPLQTNDNWKNSNRISVDIDGNYSTVDLDEIPPVEESTGNYTSIELKKRTPSKSNLNGSKNEKPIIASKPKQNVTIQDDVYSFQDKKRVKHVTAPGENGCEYAVVSKTKKSKDDRSEDQISTSNVYAIVEKKKLVFDGKGTNQKRDSFTTENDSENEQS